MYVVFSVAEFLPSTTEESAQQFLHDQLVPMIEQSPGFVKGTWFGDDRRGHGVVVYETEGQAQQGVQEVGLEMGGVVVVSSEIYRLHGEA